MAGYRCGGSGNNLHITSFNMGTAREFPSQAHPSTATLLELAQHADILCLQETHLHAHQWPGFLQSFRLATNGGTGGPLLIEADVWTHSGPQQHAPVLAVLANPKGAQRSKKSAPWRLSPDSLKNVELVAHLLELGQRLLAEIVHISDPTFWNWDNVFLLRSCISLTPDPGWKWFGTAS